MKSLVNRREEIIARALYRIWMEDDYSEFPWDDENEPSNETKEEAQEYASILAAALEDEYKLDDEKFDRVVDEAARLRLQTLVRSLEE